jgi:uncharacterized cupin superfamily protein
MEQPMPRKIDIAALRKVVGTRYPAPYDEPCLKRERRRLGDAAGLTQYGVNLLRLPHGAWSAQRHWHSREDEFVYVLAGEVTLVTDAGDEIFRAGDCAGFKAGDPDGHCFQNRGAEDALLLEVGTRTPGGDEVQYPGLDLRVVAGRPGFAHADGTPWPDTPRKA